MVRDEEKYQLATHYRKRGYSYTEIAKITGVSKGTVSNWLAKKAFSKRVKKDNEVKARRDNVKRISLLNKARGAERKTRYVEAVHSANTEFKHYKTAPLFCAGLMLYVASGDQKDPSRIRLTSNSPEQHRIFIKFMTEYVGIEKKQLSCWLLLPTGQNEEVVMKLWSKQIRLPITRFGKTQFLPQTNKLPLHNGTGNTIIGNTVLKKKLLRWIELLSKEL